MFLYFTSLYEVSESSETGCAVELFSCNDCLSESEEFFWVSEHEHSAIQAEKVNASIRDDLLFMSGLLSVFAYKGDLLSIKSTVPI